MVLRGDIDRIYFSMEKYSGLEGSTSSVFFVWTAACGKILTCEYLRRKGHHNCGLVMPMLV